MNTYKHLPSGEKVKGDRLFITDVVQVVIDQDDKSETVAIFSKGDGIVKVESTESKKVDIR